MNAKSANWLLLLVALVTAFFLGVKFSSNGWTMNRVAQWFGASPSVTTEVPQVPDTDRGQSYGVKRIQVLRGDTFDVTMKHGGRVLAKLPVTAVEEAKSKVLDLFNHGSLPRIVLRERLPDGRWTVDLFVRTDGREVNVSEWLVANNLVYQ